MIACFECATDVKNINFLYNKYYKLMTLGLWDFGYKNFKIFLIFRFFLDFFKFFKTF
jgi:hypothetical protein